MKVKYTKDYPKYQYILFDGRARSMGTDEASVLEVTTTKPNHIPKHHGDESIWARVEKLDNNKVPSYGNEQLLWEIKQK